ncbi:hypothetical protein BDZ90DRAFT_262606 [Jaminaea rosea]|uniref:Uncharacterized protein n=1 Tax=Jaminaea rosea TaxID=1569628 RepID=A0A316UIW1_9BASI|nr:hypothetical protein BDZ90DRAFT_262606 [Jaminaea rosea]PWN25159.1 hypothetical protein BDZ90DRAFT_262606 [Jaminaea rosea]
MAFQAEQTPSSSLLRPTFLAHLSSRRFHRRIICPRTASPVTFAVCGIQDDEDQNDDVDVVLYCLPSGCSRYLGFFLGGIARKARIQLIAIDRPGAGGTPGCTLEERMNTSIAQARSVLEALALIDGKGHRTKKLGGGKPIALLAHSVGLLYALAILARFNPPPEENCGNVIDVARSPFGPRPCIVCTSPWVPTSVSRSSLSFLPANVVKLSGSLPMAKLGAVWETSMGMGKGALQWSMGLVPSTNAGAETDEHPGESSSSSPVAMATPQRNPFHESLGTDPPVSPQDTQGMKRRAAAQRRAPHADFWPPYESHWWKNCAAALAQGSSSIGHGEPPLLHPGTGKPFRLTAATAQSIVVDCMSAHENVARAASADFLLCLGYCSNLPSRSIEDLLVRGFSSTLAHSEQGAEVTIVWGEKDGLVPKRGRMWLDERMKDGVRASRGRLQCERLEMAEAGHDEPIGCEEVVVALLRRVKERQLAGCREVPDSGKAGQRERTTTTSSASTSSAPTTPTQSSAKRLGGVASLIGNPGDGELGKRRGSGSSCASGGSRRRAAVEARRALA